MIVLPPANRTLLKVLDVWSKVPLAGDGGDAEAPVAPAKATNAISRTRTRLDERLRDMDLFLSMHMVGILQSVTSGSDFQPLSHCASSLVYRFSWLVPWAVSPRSSSLAGSPDGEYLH